MEAATAGGSALAAAGVLQQRHFSRAEALTYAGEERASASARTNMEMLSCTPDARETTRFEVDVRVIPQEERNFCWCYPASRAHPAAAGLTTAPSVAAPAATVHTDAATAPAPAVSAAGSPTAAAFSSPPGVAAHSPPAATFPGPPTNAAPPYTALPSRLGGATVTACEVKGTECIPAARTPSQKVSYEEASRHQQELVHAACSRTGSGPTSQIETSSSYETSLRRWLCSSEDHASVDGTPSIHCALPPEPSGSAAAAVPPKTTACAGASAGGTVAAAVSAATRSGGTPATAVSAAAAAVSADASAPPATAGAYAAVASAWSGCAPAAAFPSLAPATAGPGVGGIRNLAAGAAPHFPSQREQLCSLPSVFLAFAAGAARELRRRADFALAGSEARGTEKRLAAHAAATMVAVDALDPFKVSGGAAGAAAAVGAVETNCPQCAGAASRHAADTAAAAAGSGSGLVALTTVAAGKACRTRQQREYPSATVTIDAAAGARRRCSAVSTTPLAGAVAARPSYPHSHRAGWRCLRGSAAAAAAAVCLVCATAAEAIICRIDASEGLLAAAVAAGSAMPTAEVFSFPLCRLPYLVNSDVPARDAPHVGLYAGGSIEIDLELLPAETYANNMPLSEPRFYKNPSAASPRRQEDTHRNEGAATAASSPKRKQQQTDSPFRVHTPTAQQPQQRAVAPVAVGSFNRELLAIVGPDVAGTPAAAIASSSTAAKPAAAREGGRRQEAAAALWGTATGRDTAAATRKDSALEGATEGRRKQKGTAQAEQGEVASESQRGGKDEFVEARTGSRRTVSAAWGRSAAARVIEGPQAPKDGILQEEHGERENAERLFPFHFNGANQWRHSGSASEGVETSQKISSHRWREAAAGNSGVSVSAVEAAAFDASRPFNDRTVAAESTAASGRSVAGASWSMCPASEENIPVTTLSGSPRVLDLPSPLLSLHSFMFLDAAASFASSSVRHMWSCVRSYVALFAYSVAAAADLFFGIQASPLLLPASNKASTRAHIPFTDADRAAFPKQQPTARSALPFSLLFSSLYSATRFFVLPASNAPRQAALHQQEEEERQQQEQWQPETQTREEEQQQFSNSADRRETVTERDEATTDAALEAEEEAKAQKDSLVGPHSVVAGGTRAVSLERVRDVGAVWPSEAPKRILQGIKSEPLSRLHGLADEAERRDAKGQERLVEEDEQGDDYEEDEEGGNTDQDDVAEGQRSESHAAGKPEIMDALETKASYIWKNKAMQDRGETHGEDDAHGELPIRPYPPFTASYGGGDFRGARSVQQQQKRQQQIAAAAAAWQRQLREDNQHAVDDPLVYTVNNTYVLVMSHFQYMLFQQDSGWLRSFTATDGIVANSYVPAFKRLTFTGPKLHARVEVPKLDRYAVVLLNADGLDLRLKGRITFLNPGNQQLSVEQISLPKLLLFLLLLHLLTVAVLAIVMLSFRRRRWTRVHFLILSNLLLCALCFALDRSQTIFFQEHGQRNPVLWLAARVCRKLQDIMALMAFILIALGWKTLRSQLTRIEVQFVAGLCVISLYLGVFEIILGGFQGTRYILHALGYVCVLVAINFNLALLHSHIMDAGITPTTSDLYHKYDAFRLYRGIFFLYLIKPVSLIFFKLSLLNPIYEQLLSWDEWIFVFANNAIDYSIFLALFYAFRPGGTMRILREVSQVTASDTRSDQANVNAWPPG